MLLRTEKMDVKSPAALGGIAAAVSPNSKRPGSQIVNRV
jgi:hypothetical protein